MKPGNKQENIHFSPRYPFHFFAYSAILRFSFSLLSQSCRAQRFAERILIVPSRARIYFLYSHLIFWSPFFRQFDHLTPSLRLLQQRPATLGTDQNVENAQHQTQQTENQQQHFTIGRTAKGRRDRRIQHLDGGGVSRASSMRAW